METPAEYFDRTLVGSPRALKALGHTQLGQPPATTPQLENQPAGDPESAENQTATDDRPNA